MDVGGTFKVFVDRFRWRRMGQDAAGERLLETLESDDEQTRALAGMGLVQAGERSVDLIESAIEQGTASSQAVRLLADIGGDRARSILEAAAARGPSADAATEALDLLDRIEALDDDEGAS